MTLKLITVENDFSDMNSVYRCLEWRNYNIEIVGTAKSGWDLIQQCLNKKPDICIIDLDTEGIDGLEDVEAIHYFLPKTKCIVISENRNFDYAKQAIACGVVDYLVKPINISEMNTTINRTRESIYIEHEESKLLRFAEKKVFEGNAHIYERFIHYWILNHYSDEEVDEMLNLLHLNKKGSHMIFMIDHPDIESTSTNQPEYKERISSLHHAIQKQLKLSKLILWAPLTPRRSLGIVMDVCGEIIENTHREALELAGKQMSLEFHVVTRIVKSIKEEFQTAYEELNQAMEIELNISPVIKEICKKIEREYMNEELSLTFMAEQQHMSPHYLSRMFKGNTGLSFSEYLIQTRTRNAVRIMLTSNAPLYEVADSVGYSSQHYFSSAFKKITGLSPTEYRQNHEGFYRMPESDEAFEKVMKVDNY